ncbi:MAG: 6-phosphofructokinase [Candidatus Hydrogenedens sp.]|nr:6-phosphofructokinase [Candidatus Hydrogenedens sp.]
MKLKGKALIAQGGGPTAVINQSAVGVILEARKHPEITRIYGARHGVNGIINENFLDLTDVPTANLEAMAASPSSGLYSTRDKPDEAYCKKIFEICKAHDIRYFFYCGGNDSAGSCQTVAKEAEDAGYDMYVIHVPKTIDNDLQVTDHCPGYGSAAKFVAQAFAGVDLDNRALPGVYIGVVMGRHAGFLTAAAALGRKYSDDGPHLIYLPERTFSLEKFTSDVVKTFEEHGRCVIAVSEGIVDESGEAIAAKFTGGEKDDYGNVQLSGSGALGDMLADHIKKNTKIDRVRADTLGYLQRSFLGCVSEVDQVEARTVGEMGVRFGVGQQKSGSVTMKRSGNYAISYDLTTLDSVAYDAIEMPDEYICESGNNVTDAFISYARPLVGTLAEATLIDAPSVEKILNK